MERRQFGWLRCPDAARRFLGSIHGTLYHLLWGRRMWMSRFDAAELAGRGEGDRAALT